MQGQDSEGVSTSEDVPTLPSAGILAGMNALYEHLGGDSGMRADAVAGQQYVMTGTIIRVMEYSIQYILDEDATSPQWDAVVGPLEDQRVRVSIEVLP